MKHFQLPSKSTSTPTNATSFGPLAHLGAVAARRQWWLLPPWSGRPLALQWARMKREDAILEAEFAAAFRHLRERVLFLREIAGSETDDRSGDVLPPPAVI